MILDVNGTKIKVETAINDAFRGDPVTHVLDDDTRVTLRTEPRGKGYALFSEIDGQSELVKSGSMEEVSTLIRYLLLVPADEPDVYLLPDEKTRDLGPAHPGIIWLLDEVNRFGSDLLFKLPGPSRPVAAAFCSFIFALFTLSSLLGVPAWAWHQITAALAKGMERDGDA
jgi:hypothetical protein